MNKTQIKELIVEALNDLLESKDVNITVDGTTALMGAGSIIDSLDLVTLVVDIESRLLDEDIEVSLISEKAMSQKSSPFLSVDHLNDFISTLIN
jgi:acyl carrier protein